MAEEKAPPEEKTPGFVERNMHKCVLCGQVAAVLSIILVVPLIRKRRAQAHHKRAVPLFGH